VPQNSAVDGEGMGVDVIVEVAVSGVTETPEDELEESNVEDSSVDDELEAVLVVDSLEEVETGTGVEDEALLKLELEELEAEDLAEDTTASHLPNPA